MVEKLVGNKGPQSGDFVHKYQKMDEKFKNVSGLWIKQCISYDELEDNLTSSNGCTKDVNLFLSQLKPVIHSEDDIGIKVLGGKYDGAEFTFSDWSRKQFCNLIKLPPTVLNCWKNEEERQLITDLVSSRLTTVVGDKDKEMFVRLRMDNTLGFTIRAFLTNKYAVIDHLWVLNQVKREIPGGIVSHWNKDLFWEGGGDYLRFNALIPDSIREEKDSGYGGMFSVSNGEVGNRRYNVYPSIFRAICMNGCIWNQNRSEEMISQVHRGEIDLDMLSIKTHKLLVESIPLIPLGISNLMGLKSLETKTPILKMLASLGLDRNLMLNGNQVNRLMLATFEEPLGNNAFSFVNAITRASQDNSVFNQDKAMDLDMFAGNKMEEWLSTPSSFERFSANAGAMSLGKELNGLVAAMSA